jgi:hypothetical protein
MGPIGSVETSLTTNTRCITSKKSEYLMKLVSETEINVFFAKILNIRGPGNSVGIVTAYGLDGPGTESRWGREFLHLSRPALRPTQPPVKWGPGLSWGVKCGRGVTLTTHPLPVPRPKRE